MVNKNGPIHPIYGQCWVWTGYLRNGYGLIVHERNRKENAHRVSWTLHVGEIPDSFCVLHKCDVRNCVNPDHLFLGTKLDNMEDKVAKNRQWKPKGEKHHLVKLTESNVVEIRELYLAGRYSQQELAVQYGVTQTTIGRITRRKSWSHVKELK